MLKPADREQVETIRLRVADLLQTSGPDVKAGKFLHIAPCVVGEMEFLLKLVDRAYGRPAPVVEGDGDEIDVEDDGEEVFVDAPRPAKKAKKVKKKAKRPAALVTAAPLEPAEL